jgi:hypothetical protein
MLLILASAVIFGSESRGTHDSISLSHCRDSPNLEEQVPIYIPQEQGDPQLGSVFVASYDSQCYDGSIRTESTGVWLKTSCTLSWWSLRMSQRESTASNRSCIVHMCFYGGHLSMLSWKRVCRAIRSKGRLYLVVKFKFQTDMSQY